MGVIRFDAADPEDLKVIVENGLVWKASAEAQVAAINALLDGDLPMNDKVPPQVVQYINRQRSPYKGRPR